MDSHDQLCLCEGCQKVAQPALLPPLSPMPLGYQLQKLIEKIPFDTAAAQQLLDKGLVLNFRSYSQAIGKPNIEAIDWLHSHGCPTDIRDIIGNLLAYNHNLDGTFRSSDGFRRALKLGLQWTKDDVGHACLTKDWHYAIDDCIDQETMSFIHLTMATLQSLP